MNDERQRSAGSSQRRRSQRVVVSVEFMGPAYAGYVDSVKPVFAWEVPCPLGACLCMPCYLPWTKVPFCRGPLGVEKGFQWLA